MREVSVELAAAIEGAEQVVRARLSVDWAGDGHGGSVDDLSGKLASLRVASVLQGTQPDQVAVVEGTAAATLDVDLTAGDTDDERLQAVRYFSPFAADSPLYGLERLNRDVQADAEVLTTVGWQTVPLFRGVTRGLPVRVVDRQANLTGVDYRGRLRTQVTLPAMAADAPQTDVLSPSKPGLEGTWLVSYILRQCGFPLSPPPPTGCRIWAPMHGSAQPFIAKPLQGSPVAYLEHLPSVGLGPYFPLEFAAGPFVLGVRDASTAGLPPGVVEHWAIQYRPATGTVMVDGDGRSAGRMTAWTKRDSQLVVDVVTTRGDGPTWRPNFTPTLVLTNNGVTRNVNGPNPPNDGQWHLVGVHWDDAAGVAAFNIDGQVTTVTFTSTPTAPGGDDDWTAFCDGVGAVAELQVSTGLPVTNPWPPLVYTAPAVVDRCPTPVDGVLPPLTGEAWELLQELATTWQGAVYLSADGVPHVTTRERLVSTAAQVVQRQVTAEQHLFDLAWDLNLDKIANVITAGYQPVTVTAQDEVWRLSGTYVVHPNTSITIEASFSGALATAVRLLTGHANTKTDGTGTSYLVQQVAGSAVYAIVDYTSETSATIRIHNNAGVVLWLVDTTGQPDLRITGDVISQGASTTPVVVRDNASISNYGEQPVSLPVTRWTQRRDVAAGMAMATVGDLYQPQPVFEELPIPLDPRLEPYDRVRVTDASNTGVGIDVWVVGRTHELAASAATTTIAARPARTRYLAGVGLAGVDLVG